MRQLVLELTEPPAPTFATFHRGPNGAAVQTLEALASGSLPQRSAYLWGRRGTGRTHLLRSARQAMLDRGQEAVYVTAAELPALEPEALARAALIAIDDVGQLSAAGAQRLFDLFTLPDATAARMLFAADTAPGTLELREDVRTRLASGVILELTPLSDAEKRAALEAHARARGVPLPEGIAVYLLEHVRRDMGTQIAALEALDRHSLAQKRPLTLPLVRELIQSLDADPPR